jgi:hypothetical protein
MSKKEQSECQDRLQEDSNKVSELLSDFIRYYAFEREQPKIESVYRKPNIVKVFVEISTFGPYQIEYKILENGNTSLSYLRVQKTKDGFDEILMKQYINNREVPLSNVTKR